MASPGLLYTVSMQINKRFPAEAPWFGGVLGVALLSVVERVAFHFDPSERATPQRILDGLLLYGAFALGIALPVVSAWLSRDMPSRSSARIRVILACIWGPLAAIAAISVIANNVDGGLGLFALPLLALLSGAVSLIAVGARPGAGAPS